LRTSTHAFDYRADSTSQYRRFGWQSKEWIGGFGKQVLGETWLTHWGVHGSQATRGIIPASAIRSPILRGVSDVFGTTDVYEASPPADAQILLAGQVVAGMTPSDPPAHYRKKAVTGTEQDVNEPMMPVAWLRTRRNESGKVNRILTTTMGAATDLLNEGVRRFLVNGAYWALGMEKRIPAKSNVDFVGLYAPTKFGFDGFRRGVRPADLEWKADFGIQ
jgi:hypothetical protein